MNIRTNTSLKSYNTFGIDAKSTFLANITTVAELLETLKNEEFASLPRLILGGGSNVLFTKDFDGLVLRMNISGKEVIREDDDEVVLKVMCGEIWHELVLHCIEQGWGGIENLSLIPGRVGAAPMQNIGAYGVEIKEVFESLEAVHIESGEIHTFSNADCQFGYRESVFKKELKGQYIIVSVTLRLSKNPKFNLSYGAIQTTLDAQNISHPTLRDVSNAVISIRQSKLPDPAEVGNAGSFFKNPVIPAKQFEELKTRFPGIPNYPAPNGQIKVPAGWLIEQCGWKGKVVGQTGAHKNQALVLVNYGKASGEEVKNLAYEILDSVKAQFGIEIRPEVNII